MLPSINAYNWKGLIYHANFAILQIVVALQEHYIDDTTASWIYDKIDAYVDSAELLGIMRVIAKINEEILNDMLNLKVPVKFLVYKCTEKIPEDMRIITVDSSKL